MPIQINGKRRSQISIPLNTPNCDIEEMVLSDEVIMRAIDGLVIKKIIIVPESNNQYSSIMKLHFLLLLMLFFISACGFSPMHSPTTTNNSSLFENISVELNEIEGVGNKEVGFYLIQRIKDRVGTNPGKDVLILTPANK